jgi:hypothetical protein
MRNVRLAEKGKGVAFALLLATTSFAQQPPDAPPAQIPGVKVDVISTTPLPGMDIPLSEIAAPAQAFRDQDLEKSGALDLSDFLNRRLTNIHINEIQGNPFQSGRELSRITRLHPCSERLRESRYTWTACA